MRRWGDNDTQEKKKEDSNRRWRYLSFARVVLDLCLVRRV